ncbi:MAG: Glycine cleavage system H protein [Myxococcota bacterium]|nr:Glycine cleavage system H protein [Myxococcota bacterium]
MSIPAELKYTKDHEWARVSGDTITVGITFHAQDQLGDVVFVELPKAGTVVRKGATFGVVESTKAVSDLYAPVSGKVIEVNEALADAPEQINKDPYGAAWMIKVEFSDAGELSSLMDAAAYQEYVSSSAP